jgi:FkbM family methyltransferase
MQAGQQSESIEDKKMTLKKFLKMFIPPIVLVVIRKIKSTLGFTAKQQQSPKDIMVMVEPDKFSVGFSRVSQPSGTFFVPDFAAHRPASKAILRGQLYEPATHIFIAEYLKTRPGNLIHAGTFFGDMLPSFSNACSDTVYAFEPVMESYLLAKLCVQQNQLENVILLNAGLGSKISVSHIDTGECDGVHRGGGSEIGVRGQITSLLTIDSLGINNLSIIQLDVEGYELESLRGAAETISRNFPAVLIEDNNDECAGFLKQKNYSFCGEIPGLSIWISDHDKTNIRNIL